MLELADYLSLRDSWPREGKVILAQFDEDAVVVYQAFNAVTAAFAVEHQRLGGPRYSLTRMSWIKPNFMWMMYRCAWLERDDEQARVLAIRINRRFFDELVRRAVASSFRASGMQTEAAWKQALRTSDVRLQWDPDHGPSGNKLKRRAIQLGLRGETLRRFVFEETLRKTKKGTFGAQAAWESNPARRFWRPAPSPERDLRESVGQESNLHA